MLLACWRGAVGGRSARARSGDGEESRSLCRARALRWLVARRQRPASSNTGRPSCPGYRRVDLHAQQRLVAHVDAAHDAARDRDVVAAEGVADARHLQAQRARERRGGERGRERGRGSAHRPRESARGDARGGGGGGGGMRRRRRVTASSSSIGSTGESSSSPSSPSSTCSAQNSASGTRSARGRTAARRAHARLPLARRARLRAHEHRRRAVHDVRVRHDEPAARGGSPCPCCSSGPPSSTARRTRRGPS